MAAFSFSAFDAKVQIDAWTAAAGMAMVEGGVAVATDYTYPAGLHVLGAGDAFVATFVQSLHVGLPLDEAARRGSVAGAIVASQLACSEAMPTLEELEAELA